MKVLMVKTPLYRLVGSHNNKTPLELSYWATHFINAGCVVDMVNWDAAPTNVHWAWKKLIQNFEYFSQNMLKSSLIFELVEYVMDKKPDIVVVQDDDSFIPSVGTCSPQVVDELVVELKKQGIRTVGVGKWCKIDPNRRLFDTVMAGEANKENVQKILDGMAGVVCGTGVVDLDVLPLIDSVQPFAQFVDNSYVSGSKGCLNKCAFCHASLSGGVYTQRNVDVLRQDLSRRVLSKIYFTDLNFAYDLEFLNKLCGSLEGLKKTYLVEARVDSITEEKVRIFKSLGVVNVKLGIESFSLPFLNKVNKGISSFQQITDTVSLLKKYSLGVTAYLMLGGGLTKADYKMTSEKCKQLDFDSYVLSMWSGNTGFPDPRESHFSRYSLEMGGADFNSLEIQDLFALQDLKRKGSNFIF